MKVDAKFNNLECKLPGNMFTISEENVNSSEVKYEP